jgi:hypothetical protein
MSYRDIVILANSRRHNGHCIAGKDIATGEWIRPINTLGRGQIRQDPSAFLDEDLKTLTGSPSGPQLLDCVRIGFEGRCPLYYQPENIAIDGLTWERRSSFAYSRIHELIDPPETCCLQDTDPYYKTIPAKDLLAHPATTSLSFIRLHLQSNNVVISHTTSQAGNPQHRLAFNYGVKRYNLPITDYRYEQLVAQSANDDAGIFNDCFVTIGLGEKYSPYDTKLELHYRFIVGIIPANET